MTITLTQLRTQSRQRSDMENSNFITDSELNDYINASIAELHDLLISAHDGDYKINSVTFSTAAGTTDYALPNGTNYSAATAFYKLKGVDILDGSEWIALNQFNFKDRNRSSEVSWNTSNSPTLKYRLLGSNLSLSPDPGGTYTVKLWYIPVATKLTADADTFDDLNQYSEYVILDAAIKMKEKEESDVSVLAAQKMAMQQRIVSMAANRDAGDSESIIDVYRYE